MFRWLSRIANAPDRHALRAMRQFSACIDAGDQRGDEAIVLHAKGQALLDRLLLLACMHQIKNDDLPWMRRGKVGQSLAMLLVERGANVQARVRFPHQLGQVDYRDPIIFLALEHGDATLFHLMLGKLDDAWLRKNNGTLLLEQVFCGRTLSLDDSVQAIGALLHMGAPYYALPLHMAQHPRTLQLILDKIRAADPGYLLQKNEGLRRLSEQPLGPHGEHMLRKLFEAGADPHDLEGNGNAGCAFYRAMQGGHRDTFMALHSIAAVRGDAPMDGYGNTLWHALAKSLSYNDGYYNRWNRLDETQQAAIERVAMLLGDIDHEQVNHLGASPKDIAYTTELGRTQWDCIVERLAQKTRLDSVTTQASATTQARRL
jgi:hypothetical protein